MMEKLLDLTAVADILGISLVTAKIWASKRRFPVVRVGRLIRVAPEALEEWIRENTTQTLPQDLKARLRTQKRPKTGIFDDVVEELRRDRPQQGGKP